LFFSYELLKESYPEVGTCQLRPAGRPAEAQAQEKTRHSAEYGQKQYYLD